MRLIYKAVILLVLSGGLFSSCSEDSDETIDDGNWIKRSSFEGVARSGAVSFVIGDKAYVGLGYDGDDYLTDFWTYDSDENFWKRMSDFPGIGRIAAVAFSIGEKGYVATGYDGDDHLSDFWEYDPASDSWNQLEDFAGSARYLAVGFSIGEYGYLGTGYDGNYLKDFWQYSPSIGEWEQIISYKGEKRQGGSAFVIGDEAYVGLGTNNGLYETDHWEFDSENTDWIQLVDVDDDDEEYSVQRQNAVTFALNGKGYVSLGSYGSNINTTWEYTPQSDIWTEKTAFEGSGRTGAVSFTINGRSFIALGSSGTLRYDDVWEFVPDEVYDEDD